MNGYAKLICAGTITRDPELRYLPNGKPVADLSVAVNRSWKNEAGEKQEETTFLDWVAFGRSAEVLVQYLKKGIPVLLDGRPRQETWQDKQTNQKRSKLKMVVEGFTFLPSGQGNPQGAAASERSAAAGTSTAQQGFADMKAAAGVTPASPANPQPSEPIEDDVPF